MSNTPVDPKTLRSAAGYLRLVAAWLEANPGIASIPEPGKLIKALRLTSAAVLDKRFQSPDPRPANRRRKIS